jgi:hypothetical protein
MTVDVRPPSTSTSVPQPHEETFPRRADPGPPLVDARWLNADRWNRVIRGMRGLGAVLAAVGAVAFLGAAAVLGSRGWWVPGPLLGGLFCVATAAALTLTPVRRVTGVTVTATTVQVNTRTTLARVDLTEVNLWTTPQGARVLVVATPRRRLHISQSDLAPSDWRALCRELRPTGADPVVDLGLDVVPGGQSTRGT